MTPGEFRALAGTPEDAADSLRDVLAAVRAARGEDWEGFVTVISHTSRPHASLAAAVAVIADLLKFAKVGDDTAEGALAAVEKRLMANFTAAAEGGG